MKFLRLLICFLLILIVVVLPIQGAATANGPDLLSELSELECLEFVKANGIDIPDYFEDETQWGKYIKSVIQIVENNPECYFNLGDYVLSDFYNNIACAVNCYYEISCVNPCQSIQSRSAYILQDSSVYTSWESAHNSYNCYSFALGITDSPHTPGEICQTDEYEYDINDNIYTLASGVKYDLISSEFNMKCVIITTTRPTYSSLLSGYNAICIRKGSPSVDSEALLLDDFHFMKLTSDGWLHKPGHSTILQYSHLPSTALDWTNEAFIDGVANAPNYTYSGDIYYIIYRQDHVYAATKTGNHYHAGKSHYFEYAEICAVCGNQNGEPYWQFQSCSGPPCFITININETDCESK